MHYRWYEYTGACGVVYLDGYKISATKNQIELGASTNIFMADFTLKGTLVECYALLY